MLARIVRGSTTAAPPHHRKVRASPAAYLRLCGAALFYYRLSTNAGYTSPLPRTSQPRSQAGMLPLPTTLSDAGGIGLA